MLRQFIFEEPIESNYLYIDDQNQVHLMLPIVGGDEIGVDNTCQSATELKNFFFGGIDAPSASETIQRYMTALRTDIERLNRQNTYSLLETLCLIQKKTERLQQMRAYSQLLNHIMLESSIRSLNEGGYPSFPTGITNMLAESKNAFAIRLDPRTNDGYLRFENPLFSVR